MRRSGGLPLILALVFLCHPAPSGSQEISWRAQLEAQVRARGLEPSQIIIPHVLNQEMLDWLGSHVQEGGSPERTLERLLSVMVDPEGLGLDYDASRTATAAEAFAERTANCLAFTHLFVAFAREIGVPAYYVNFRQAERFRREGDLVLVSGHVTAGFGSGRERRVLDFGVIPEEDYDRTQVISDITALALHHSNRGAELLRDGELDEALRMSEIAVKLDPGLSNGWVNVGVARRRTGDLDGAERAYRRAIDINPNHTSAYQNLSTLFWLRGEVEASREMLRILDSKKNRNPYLYLDLGDMSLLAGKLEDAGKYYRRASVLAPNEAETRAARGIWALKSGKIAAARRWLRRAGAVDPDERRVLELQRLLRVEDGLESTRTTKPGTTMSGAMEKERDQ